MSRWTNFERYCIEVTPILEAISRNGLGIDPSRQQSLFETLTKERDLILEKIQHQIPRHLKPRKFWKRPPKNMQGVISLFPGEVRKCQPLNNTQGQKDTIKDIDQQKPIENTTENTCISTEQKGAKSGLRQMGLVSTVGLGKDLNYTTSTTEQKSQDQSKLPTISGYIQEKQERTNSSIVSPYVESAIKRKQKDSEALASSDTEKEQLTKSMDADVLVANELKSLGPEDFANIEKSGYKYMKEISWNPRSWQQIQALAVAMGAKLPRKENAESDDDTATSAKVLKRVAKKHPVFADILKFKERDKLITAYNWPLDKDNRVHSTYSFHPSTWRKSCRNPNMQVIPKSVGLAKQFRKMIVPRPGNVLIEGDSVGIEALLTGWLAGSKSLMRLAAAGIHDWTASAYHGFPISLELSDADLKAACKEAKNKWPEEHDKFKKVVYASLYLATPRRIAEEHPEEFEREAEAAKLQAFFFNTEPGKDVKAWQKQTIEIAHANKGLENHFGLRHRFYSLYSYDSRRKCYVLGEDAKRAVAFVPQSDASFVQSDILLRLVERDVRFLGWLVAIVHDSIILDVPRDVADYCALVLREEMVRPVVALDNLFIGAAVKLGSNLGDYDAGTNPDGMKEWKCTL